MLLARARHAADAVLLFTTTGVVQVRGRLKQDLDKDFLDNLGLHARTLIHVKKIATADLRSCPAIQLLVFECLYSKSILTLLY